MTDKEIIDCAKKHLKIIDERGWKGPAGPVIIKTLLLNLNYILYEKDPIGNDLEKMCNNIEKFVQDYLDQNKDN